ncbi:MAG: M1 family aminopeptidase [Pseudohongiellaceae bacterium]
MSGFREILRFELAFQFRSLLFVTLAVVAFLIHLLTITATGIGLTDNNQIALNSSYLIIQGELVLGAFGTLPIIAFVINAMLRDYERGTFEFFLVSPLRKTEYLAGRFLGSLMPALVVGMTGLLGTLVGTFMPWADQSRVMEFSSGPYFYSLFLVVIPNVLIACGLFFSVAALTRSVAMTFGLAVVFVSADMLLNLWLGPMAQAWVGLADPFGTLPVAMETRYWTVAELNSQLPVGLLPANRLLWLAITAAILYLTFLRFPFNLDSAKGTGRKRGSPKAASGTETTSEPQSAFLSGRPPVQASAQMTGPAHTTLGASSANPNYSFSGAVSQYLSQLRMDIAFVLGSPLFLLLLLLAVSSALGEFYRGVSLMLDIPLQPLTSRMLVQFRYGLLPSVVIIAIYYSAALIHREREVRISEIVNTAPFPGWTILLAKATTLWLIVTALLLTLILSSIAMQLSAGYTDIEFGLYLQTAFIYNGFYYFMLCVLAVTLQSLLSNKWAGMLVLSVCYLLLFSLGMFGFEHLLYRFEIPFVLYSDMNGYGHFSQQVYALIVYWTAGCVLLLIVALLFYPRGYTFYLRERLAEARSRFSRPVQVTLGLAMLVFVSAGGWIYYNSNVLNRYETDDSRLAFRADYEQRYGRYDGMPVPTFADIDMALDIYPEERRIESRGTAILVNSKRNAIDEFVISVDPRVEVRRLEIENAALLESDSRQGFYLFRPAVALQSEQQLNMHWEFARGNRGFVNTGADDQLVENGTYIDNFTVMPLPGFDDTRRIESAAERAGVGLPPAPRLAALGDPAWLDRLSLGVDRRSGFRAVVSTAADQIVVAPGVLLREWTENGRRYFEYEAEQPIWPVTPFTSARYEVARDQWNHVTLEVYFHPQHRFNVDSMLETAKQSLEYFGREFGEYPFSHFRIMEYPRYRTAASARPGLVPYSEALSFIMDLSPMDNVDYVTIHELAHTWWGNIAPGAKMQGREMLNETMAQYSTLMLFNEYHGIHLVNPILEGMQDGYLNARGSEGGDELPVMYNEDQGYISYNKGAMAMYALQDLIGTELVHQGLRNFLARFAMQPPPFATAADLVGSLREVTPPEHQDLITDLFEKIVLYDLQMEGVSYLEIADGYEVTLELNATKFEASGTGVETEVPLQAWFDLALFPAGEGTWKNREPLYIQKHLLGSGSHSITITVPQLPEIVSADPYRKMIDRSPQNNFLPM